MTTFYKIQFYEHKRSLDLTKDSKLQQLFFIIESTFQWFDNSIVLTRCPIEIQLHQDSITDHDYVIFPEDKYDFEARVSICKDGSWSFETMVAAFISRLKIWKTCLKKLTDEPTIGHQRNLLAEIRLWWKSTLVMWLIYKWNIKIVNLSLNESIPCETNFSWLISQDSCKFRCMVNQIISRQKWKI